MPNLVVHQHGFVHIVALTGSEENHSSARGFDLWPARVTNANRSPDFRVKSLVQSKILYSLVLEEIHPEKLSWLCFLCRLAQGPPRRAFVTYPPTYMVTVEVISGTGFTL